MKKGLIIFGILFFISFVSASPLNLVINASETTILKGETVDFNAQVIGGTPPYSYCWDFGTPPQNAKLGEWNHDAMHICYSTEKNTEHKFNQYGEYQSTLYVRDRVGNSEKSLIPIFVEVKGNVYDATNCVSGPCLVNNGFSDNGNALSTWANSKGEDNITVFFESGSYLFSLNNYFSGSSGLNAIQLEPYPDSDVIFIFNSSSAFDNNTDVFLETNNGATLYVKNIKIQSEVKDGSPENKDMSIMFKNGIGVFQECSIFNFSTPFADSRPYVVIKNNLLDWGPGISHVGPSYLYRHQLFEGTQNNAFVKQNYAKTSYPHEHIIYTPGGREYIYSIGNYYDVSNGIGSTYPYHFHGGAGHHQNKYFYRDFLYNSPSAFMTITGSMNLTEFKDCIFDTGPGMVNLISDQTTFAFNHFQNITKFHNFGLGHIASDSCPINYFYNNTWGQNAPTRGTYELQSDDCEPCSGWTSDPNPSGCGCIIATGNINDDSTHNIPDPGPYEFTSPTVNSFIINNDDSNTSSETVTLNSNVVDSGSGMGSSARFPFTEGALMQFSNDGINWYQVENYASFHSWNLTTGSGTKTVYARFRDVDGNWGDVVSDTILLSSSSSCSQVDNNENSVVEIGELLTYISLWKSGSVTIGNLLTAISEWKSGC